MLDSSGKLVSFLVKIVPYACLSLSIAALGLLYILGRSDFAIKSLYLFVPVIIASVIAIINPGLFNKYSFNLSSSVSLSASTFRNLVLLFIFLYIISLCILARSDVRPFVYFVIVGILSILIFIEILAYGEANPSRRVIILFQIFFLSANLIFGQTLRLPLFFGYGDTLAHMKFIDTIIETGRITPAMGDYQHFPIFHIFGAISTLLSGLDLQTSYFLFNGSVFILSILAIYLLISLMTRNIHLPLTAALIYALNREVIFGGMYMITRVMAFVFCFMLLYLLIRGRTSVKMRSIALFLVVPLVLMHQTTLLHFSGILFFLVIIEIIIYRYSWYIGVNFFLFFTVAYLGYWFWLSFSFIKNVIVNVASTPDMTDIPLSTLDQPLYKFFTSNADAILITFLLIIGFISLLRTKIELLTIGIAFSLFSLVAFFVSSPGITQFLAHIFLTYRLPLLVSPFIAFATAKGLLMLGWQPLTDKKDWKSVTRIGISLVIVFFLALSSTIILGNSTDLNINQILMGENRQYFIESEVAAFSFADEYGQDIFYYGDYPSSRYMKEFLDMPVAQTFDVFNPESITIGYLLFRKQELESRGQLGFTIWGQGDSEEQEYIYRNNHELDLQALWEQENKIFDSGTLYIYLKKTTN